MLDDIAASDQRQAHATDQALELSRKHWPDDPLITILGMGPVCLAAIRGWWGDATQFPTANAAVAHTGLNPSMWSSGLTESPSRRITKQGPAELRLALYQAANVARRHDPQLAQHYRRLMTERGHNHMRGDSGGPWLTSVRGSPHTRRKLLGLLQPSSQSSGEEKHLSWHSATR